MVGIAVMKKTNIVASRLMEDGILPHGSFGIYVFFLLSGHDDLCLFFFCST